MMKFALRLAGAVFFGLSSFAFALPVTETISDQYVGSNDHGWGDVIGDNTIFDVDHMDVTFDGDTLAVKIITKFKENPGVWYGDIHYGDLFISTDGWHPHGSAPYTHDNFGNGEEWELLVDTGEAQVYDQFGVRLTQHVHDSGVFRNGQGVLRNSRAGSHVIANADVVIQDQTINGQLWNTLLYTMSMSSLGIDPGDPLGFKWSMTTANDSIEGSASAPLRGVPEPGALALFGLGTLCLAIVRRKRVTARNN